MGAHSEIGPEIGSTMRIDKLLWFLRLACSRSFAQHWASDGHIRLNGRRIERPSATVREGDVIVLALRDAVRVIKVLAIPERRGPAPEAQACYRFVDTRKEFLPDDHNGRA